jgi:hypothetical protein
MMSPRRLGRCLQRESPGRVPIRMRGEDMQRAAPRRETEESGPLVGTSKAEPVIVGAMAGP